MAVRTYPGEVEDTWTLALWSDDCGGAVSWAPARTADDARFRPMPGDTTTVRLISTATPAVWTCTAVEDGEVSVVLGNITDTWSLEFWSECHDGAADGGVEWAPGA